MEEKRIISAPFTDETIRSLHAGDMVYISGTIYTARDAAHKRLCEMLDAGEPMPFDFEGQVIDALKEHTGVYFAAIGGAAALMAKAVKEAEVIAFDELGTEAIRRLRVEELPVIVAIDHEGNDMYKLGVEKYRQ